MFYRMKVAGLERDLPICPVTDTLYIAGFVIFGDQELTVACARELLACAPEYDYIITAWPWANMRPWAFLTPTATPRPSRRRPFAAR